MKKLIIAIGAIIILFILYSTITTVDQSVNENQNQQSTFSFEPISHATFVAEFAGQTIYVDPIGDAEVFSDKEQPELILLTDTDGDHFDIETIQGVLAENTKIIAPEVAYDELPQELQQITTVVANGEFTEFAGISFESVPMYNLPESEDAYHVKGVGNGYVLEHEGERIYIAGDNTEDTPEFISQQDIDVAFVPMNLPYTMGIESAADGVLAFAPDTVYPYHYRGQDGLSDVGEFQRLVESQNSEINVVLLDWYPEREEESESNSSESAMENTYQISDQSTVSYTAQKEFFSKPTEPVTGTTGDVSGQININSQDSIISVNANINPETLESGSGARDRYVRDQFDSEISINVDEYNFGSFGQVSLTVPVSLTINDITRTEEFQISGSISESELELIGSTQIDMTNYSIEPATAANVYTVDEVAEISFDLVATK